jgi:hypothetical protein
MRTMPRAEFCPADLSLLAEADKMVTHVRRPQRIRTPRTWRLTTLSVTRIGHEADWTDKPG